MRRTFMLMAVLAAALLPGCAGKEAPPAAPAQANATAEAPPALPAAPALAEPEVPRGVQEQTITEPEPPARKKTSGKEAAKKETAKAGKASAACYKLSPKTKKSRCEPQCIPYARCRSGITSCRLGRENNSLTWFACEKKNGATADTPTPGAIMILKANAARLMPTGHALYVEKVAAKGQDTYLLTLSHANYDRFCGLEVNAQALFNRKSMRVDFLSGEWKDWGKDLAVHGFIAG